MAGWQQGRGKKIARDRAITTKIAHIRDLVNLKAISSHLSHTHSYVSVCMCIVYTWILRAYSHIDLAVLYGAHSWHWKLMSDTKRKKQHWMNKHKRRNESRDSISTFEMWLFRMDPDFSTFLFWNWNGKNTAKNVIQYILISWFAWICNNSSENMRKAKKKRSGNVASCTLTFGRFEQYVYNYFWRVCVLKSMKDKLKETDCIYRLFNIHIHKIDIEYGEPEKTGHSYTFQAQ